MEDFIELKIPDNTPGIEIEIKTDLFPKRVIIEYELTTKIKDISKEDKRE